MMKKPRYNQSSRFKIEPNIKSNGMGIYAIFNTLNKRIYIGSTNLISCRLRSHRLKLLNLKHYNNFLQNDWNKDQSVDFLFYILEYTNIEEELLNLEQKWLDLYYDKQIKCYNADPIANNSKGTRKTLEQKELLSQIHAKRINKKLYQFDLDGNLLDEFDTIAQAKKETGITGIFCVLKDKTKNLTAGGFLWGRNIDEGKEKSILYYNSKQIRSEKRSVMFENFSEEHKNEIKTSIRKLLGKKIYQFDLEGNLINEYESLMGAFEKTNIHSIHKSLKKNCMAGGFLWGYNPNDGKERAEIYKQKKIKLKENQIARFKKNNPFKIPDEMTPEYLEKLKEISIKGVGQSVYQFDLEGNFIAYFETYNEAERITKVKSNNISKAAKNKLTSSGNFLWSKFSDNGLEKSIIYKTQKVIKDKKEFERNKKKNSKIQNKINSKIYQFDLDGNLSKEYKNIGEATKITKISSISKCTRNMNSRHSAGNFLWSKSPDDGKEKSLKYKNNKFNINK